MRPSGVRWSEQDLTKFTRNSGRGLPKPTLQHIANATGEAVDIHGEPIPASTAELEARAQVKETKRKMEPAKKRKVKRGKTIEHHAIEHVVSKEAIEKALYADTAPGKYRNTKRVRDGIKFDSILEADKYTELCFQVKAGEITYFLRQVPIHLPGGVILRVDFVTYKATEFTVGEQPTWLVRYLDTKGHQTRESKNKIKQAMHEYGITVELVKKVRKLRS